MDKREYIISRLNTIPKKNLSKRVDCNDVSNCYLSDHVVQLVPSTHPVFLFDDISTIVKVFEKPVSANNEIKARTTLAPYLRVNSATKFVWGKYTCLSTPYIRGSKTFSQLSNEDYWLFEKQSDAVAFDFWNYISNNISRNSRWLNKVRYPGRTKKCLLDWMRSIRINFSNMCIFSSITNKIYDLDKVLDHLYLCMKNASNSCCLFSGDFNMNNILYCSSEYCLIDLEYWGYYDTEYIVSKYLGSYPLHCDIFDSKSIKKNNNVYRINYTLKNNKMIEHSIKSQLARGAEMGLNLDRIKAFVISRMYYRLLSGSKLSRDSALIIMTYVLDL